LLYNWMTANGFVSNAHDPCLYTKWTDPLGPIHVVAHVDDIGCVGKREQVDKFYSELSNSNTGFSITRHGALGTECKRYLGIEVERTPNEFILSNDHLIDGLLEKVGNQLKQFAPEEVAMRDLRLSNEDAVRCPIERSKQGLDKLPFRSYLGGIGYIMLSTRPDLAYSYKELARFNTIYGKSHWEALLRTLSYLKKTKDSHKLHISKSGEKRLSAYCDADWNAADVHLSTTGWIVFYGNSPISWCSQMQAATARSTCESEYLSLSHCAMEVVYLTRLCKSMHLCDTTVPIVMNQGPENEESAYKVWRDYMKHAKISDYEHIPAMVWSDSQNAISNVSQPFGWLMNKLRHIKTAFHFVKQYVIPNDTGVRLSLEPAVSDSFNLKHVRGEDNPSDILTKGFGDAKVKKVQKAETFQRHAHFCLGMRNYQK
jgi:hypothetical protein